MGVTLDFVLAAQERVAQSSVNHTAAAIFIVEVRALSAHLQVAQSRAVEHLLT
jgi:hypothetical protein